MIEAQDPDAYNKRMRQDTRFPPEPNCLVHVDVSQAEGEFRSEIIGLVLDESNGGCGAVFVLTDALAMGTDCRVRVGNQEPVKALVRWRSNLEDRVVTVGFQYVFEDGGGPAV